MCPVSIAKDSLPFDARSDKVGYYKDGVPENVIQLDSFYQCPNR